MKNKDLVKILNSTVYSEGEERELKGGYCGDFLSFVMNKAPSDCVWFTIMSNINVAAVASLADVAAVIICEGVKPDEALINKMKLTGQTLYGTDLTIFEAVNAVIKNGLDA